MSPEEKAEKLRRFLQQIAPEENLEGLAQESALEGMADEDTERANAGVRKLAQGEHLEEDDMFALEAIILPRERPVVNIVGDNFNAPPAPWTDLGSGDKKAHLVAAIPSIGRVEVPDHPKVPYGGTGFVVGDGLLMTNRHVAELFTSGLGRRGLEFKPGQTAGLDFRREVVPSDPVFVEVKEVLMVHPYWDMALLSVAGLPAGHGSLTLDVAHPDDLKGREIAIVGYPAQDWRNDLDLQNRIFGGIYNVKRLQPGKLTGRGSVRSYGKPVDALTHDSSTLGGNSGSAVVDVTTGRIVGLHFAGRYLEANFAVPTHELARDSRVVDAGVSFSGTVESTAAWASFWDKADPATEGASPSPAVAVAGPVTRGEGAAASWTIPLRITVTLDE